MDVLILIEKYFLMFMLYSIGGWCIEEVHCSYIEKKIVDRGFLIGPVCPIYGFGGLAMTFFLTKFIQSPITVFCMGIFICAILEYFTSYIMEKMFNARWWDYSHEKLNLNGRICLRTLIPFGLFGILLIYFVNPVLYKAISNMQIMTLHIIAGTIAGIMLLDILVSFSVIFDVTKKANNIREKNPKDNTNEITAKVKEELKQTVAGSRLVEAFPNFTTLTTKIKEIAEITATKGKNAVNIGKEKVVSTAKKSKEAVIKGKDKVTEKAKNGKEIVIKKISKKDNKEN